MAITYYPIDDCDSLTGWTDFLSNNGGRVSASTAFAYSGASSFKIDSTTASLAFIIQELEATPVTPDYIYSMEYWVYFPAGWAASAVTARTTHLPGFWIGSAILLCGSVEKVGSDIVWSDGESWETILPEETWIHCTLKLWNDSDENGDFEYSVGSNSGAGWHPGGGLGGPPSALGFGIHVHSDEAPAFYVDNFRMSGRPMETPEGCPRGDWTDDFDNDDEWEPDPNNLTAVPVDSADFALSPTRSFKGSYGDSAPYDSGWGTRRGYLTGGIYGDVWQKYNFYIPAGFWDDLFAGGDKFVVLPGFEIGGGFDGASTGGMYSPSLQATSAVAGRLNVLQAGAATAITSAIVEEQWYELIMGSCFTGNDDEDFAKLYLDEVLVNHHAKGDGGLIGTAPGGIYGACWSYDQGYLDTPVINVYVDDWQWSPCDSLDPEGGGGVDPALLFIPIIMRY